MRSYKKLFTELGPGDISDKQITKIEKSPDIFQHSVLFQFNNRYLKPLFGRGKEIKADLYLKQFSTRIGEKGYTIEVEDFLEISFKEEGRPVTAFSRLSQEETIELFSLVKACCQLKILGLQFENLKYNPPFRGRAKEFYTNLLSSESQTESYLFNFYPVKTIPKLSEDELKGLHFDGMSNELYISGKTYGITFVSKSQTLENVPILYDLKKNVFYKDLSRSITDDKLKIKGKDEGFGFFIDEDKKNELMERITNIQNKFSRYSKIRERLYTKLIQKLGFEMKGNDQFIFPKEEVQKLKDQFKNIVERKLN